MKKTHIIFISLIIISFIGCKKGDVGPQGATGPQGPTGAYGPKGATGNANVKADTFSLVSADWKWKSSYAFSTSPSSYTEYFTRFHDRSFSAITQNVVDAGAVLVYFTASKTANANAWVPLPAVFTNDVASFNYQYTYEIMTGKVRLHFFMTAIKSSPAIPTLSSYSLPNFKFKIIAIGGTIASRIESGQVEFTMNELKEMNYADACKVLNISE